MLESLDHLETELENAYGNILVRIVAFMFIYVLLLAMNLFKLVLFHLHLTYVRCCMG